MSIDKAFVFVAALLALSQPASAGFSCNKSVITSSKLNCDSAKCAQKYFPQITKPVETASDQVKATNLASLKRAKAAHDAVLADAQRINEVLSPLQGLNCPTCGQCAELVAASNESLAAAHAEVETALTSALKFCTMPMYGPTGGLNSNVCGSMQIRYSEAEQVFVRKLDSSMSEAAMLGGCYSSAVQDIKDIVAKAAQAVMGIRSHELGTLRGDFCGRYDCAVPVIAPQAINDIDAFEATLGIWNRGAFNTKVRPVLVNAVSMLDKAKGGTKASYAGENGFLATARLYHESARDLNGLIWSGDFANAVNGVCK